MKTIQCEQYSPEWWEARRGVPTASNFAKLITPTGKPSTQAAQYMFELLAESVIGEDETQTEPSEWMLRGTELEAEARDWYSMKVGAEVEEVGFVLHDSETFGCSPDGIIAERPVAKPFGLQAGLEIKCPKASTHLAYLSKGELPPIYAPQVHGQLLATGFSRWVFISYHPSFAPFIIEVTPNEYTAKLKVAVEKFVTDMAAAKVRLGL